MAFLTGAGTVPLVDSHVHSRYSEDGQSSLAELAEGAIHRGLSAFCLTDHFDSVSEYDVVAQKREFELTREDFRGKLTLLRGVELGEAILVPERAAWLLDHESFDFVLGSHHHVRGQQDFYYLRPKCVDECRTVIGQYVAELAEVVDDGRFDVLAHLTYPLRYMVYRTGLAVDFSPWRDALEVLFTKLAYGGKGLELNVSGLRKPERFTLPDLDLLKLYRKCGGEIVTVGSDAHVAADVGQCIDEGYELLREAGFGYVACYVERKPQMLKL